MMLKWFYKMFLIPFEEDEILFKVKVKKGNQSYHSICWVKAYGYWKFSGDLLWTKIGLIYAGEGEATNYRYIKNTPSGKYTPDMLPQFLNLTKQKFIEESKQGIHKNILRMSVQELIPLIDGKK